METDSSISRGIVDVSNNHEYFVFFLHVWTYNLFEMDINVQIENDRRRADKKKNCTVHTITQKIHVVT